MLDLLFAFQEHVGVDPEDVHLIGHSLGAHIVGYAGERIKGLGRITGNGRIVREIVFCHTDFIYFPNRFGSS